MPGVQRKSQEAWSRGREGGREDNVIRMRGDVLQGAQRLGLD